MIKASVLIISLLLILEATCQNRFLPQTNGPITAMVKKGDTLIFGGDFNELYIPDSSSAYGTMVDLFGNIKANWASPNGAVMCAIPDGKNGVYIGGVFSSVGDYPRCKVAHLDNSGRVMPDLAGVAINDTVKALLLIGDTLYIAGGFDSVSGVFRKHLAAINLLNNQVIDWNPLPNGAVTGLCGAGSTIYVTGNFTTIGGRGRNWIAALNTNDSGTATAWNPEVNNSINTMALLGNKLLIGGLFSQSGGKPRSAIAAINLGDTGIATEWNPGNGLIGEVRALSIAENRVYVVGSFSYIGGASRKDVAAIDTGGEGRALPWVPKLVATSYEQLQGIAVNANKVIIYGFNTSSANKQRQVFLKSYETALSAKGTKFSIRGLIEPLVTIAAIQDGIYIGGNYGLIGGISCSNLTAWCLSTNKYCGSSSLGFEYKITAMCLNGDSLFVFGEDTTGLFGRVGVFNPYKSTWLTNWPYSIRFKGVVKSMVAKDDALYLGGMGFKETNAHELGGLVKFNLSTMKLDSFAYCDTVSTLALHGNDLFVGGSFEKLGLENRQYIGVINLSTRKVNAWNPEVNNKVTSLLLLDSTILIGGEFDTVKGMQRKHFCEVKLSDALPTNWQLTVDSAVHYLDRIDSLVYLAGSFGTVDGLERKGIARLNLNTRTLSSWSPKPAFQHTGNTGVIAKVIHDGQQTILGGNFTLLSGIQRANLASLSLDGNTQQTFPYLLVDKNTLALNPLDPVSASLSVSSNVSWTVVEWSDWVGVSASDTIADGSVLFNVDSNSGSSRVGYVVIEGGGIQRKITIYQEGVQLNLLPQSILIPVEGMISYLKVEANYYWSVSTDQPWLNLNFTQVGNLIHYFSVPPNWSYLPRSGVITVKSGHLTKQVNVSQNGIPPVLILDKDSIICPPAGDTFRLKVICDYYWSANTNLPWIHLSAETDSGNGEALIVIDKKISSQPRTGVITFTSGSLSKLVYVIQDSLTTGLSIVNASLPSFQLYPNPASNEVNIERGYAAYEVVEFYNALGVLMLRQELTGTKTTIKTDTWPSGLYYLRGRAFQGQSLLITR